jgi:uncharacterized membrane protein SpoIIM required for sporulation
MIVDLTAFVQREKPIWTELEAKLGRLEKDPDHSPTLVEAQRLYYLYERTCSALTRVNTFAAEPALVSYLESLLARAYGQLNSRSASARRWSFRAWLLATFSQTFRRYFRYYAFGIFLTLVGGAFGAGAVYFDPDAKAAIVPFAHLLGDPRERVRSEEHGQQSASELNGYHSTFSAELLSNNTHVAFLALALGMTWSLGTVLILFYNGVILGAIVVDYLRAGEAWFLAGWLLPHGVVEIPAILVAGQAGFLLGQALIGWNSAEPMAQRLRLITSPLATLAGGSALMLVWAALVESFLSQYHQPVVPYAAKITFGCLELVGLVLYLTLSGRKRQDVPA